MARSTKITSAASAMAPARTKRRSIVAEPAPGAPPPAKKDRAAPGPAVKPTSSRSKSADAAVPAAAPTRVPPPSKGELRAHIEKLEAANAALKAEGRETNRNAKAAARRIAELEEQVTQLQADGPKKPLPAAPVAVEAKTVRRGRPPGRSKTIDPSDAVPPGVAVQDPEPLDEDAANARDALENSMSAD